MTSADTRREDRRILAGILGAQAICGVPALLALHFVPTDDWFRIEILSAAPFLGMCALLVASDWLLSGMLGAIIGTMCWLAWTTMTFPLHGGHCGTPRVEFSSFAGLLLIVQLAFVSLLAARRVLFAGMRRLRRA